MVAFNFTVFVDKVESGEKRCTLRKTARAKVGDKLQLYTGMMHKHCRKLRPDETCTAAYPVQLHEHAIFMGEMCGHYLDRQQSDQYARLDGFDDYAHMLEWFKKTYPKDNFPVQLYATEW